MYFNVYAHNFKYLITYPYKGVFKLLSKCTMDCMTHMLHCYAFSQY